MMWQEFEELAGYRVSLEDYEKYIEPMYMGTNIPKQEFVKMVNRKRFEIKEERKPFYKRMLVRNRAGSAKTPNGAYYYIEYVDLMKVDIRTGKYIVRPLTDDELREICKTKNTDLDYWYDIDYTDCVDYKTKKPVGLNWY